MGFPGGSVVKNPFATAGHAGDVGSIPGLGRSLGGGHGDLLQYFCWENSVLPGVRIPEREERRLSRQCNSQNGKFITDLSQGFLLQPTQWCRVRKALSRGC